MADTGDFAAILEQQHLERSNYLAFARQRVQE